MAQVFPLQIISPAAVMVDAEVSMVEVPGLEGDFGVLANHAPFFSMIRPGVIRVTHTDGRHQNFFASAGYADVSPAGTTILSDNIRDLREVTAADAQQALAEARAATASAVNDSERAKAAKLLSAAEALVLAV